MATEEHQITEQNLLEVFNRIKEANASRTVIMYDDFKQACLKYRPACLMPSIKVSQSSGDTQALLGEIELHFSNICESCSLPVEK